MPQGKVSVIIPAFNRALYIGQTIGSVLQQTYADIEIIVIDDGSSDGTRDVLESYRGKIHLLEHPQRQNRGQSASINLGLEHAQGNYLCILDSDDYWEPEKIELQVRYLEQHPEVGLVYSNGTAVNSEGKYLYDIYPPAHREENRPEKVLLDCYIHLPSNSMLRMDVVRKAGGFDQTLRAAQDHDMLLRVAEITRLGYLDKSLYHYRRHDESISKSSHGALRRWRNGFVILEKARKRYPYTASAVRRRKAVLYFRLYQCSMEVGARFTALPYLLLAGLHDPRRACSVMLGRERVRSPH